MFYEQSLTIERRLHDLLQLIRAGDIRPRHSRES